jgi:myo-inositol-1-phosphate synthase
MRRVRTLLAALTLATGLVFIGGSPAQAATPTVRMVYFDYAGCVAAGDNGVAQGLWTSYWCQYRYDGRDVYVLWA